MSWKRLGILLLLSSVGTLGSVPAHSAALGLGGKQKKKEAEKREPYCFLHGDAVRNPRGTPGTENVGSMIRLRFEASEPEECMIQFEYYCRKEIVGKGHAVRKLNGFFQDQKGRTDYSMAPDCSVKKVVPEGEQPTPSASQ